jgi:hypothetical protein
MQIQECYLYTNLYDHTSMHYEVKIEHMFLLIRFFYDTAQKNKFN